MGTTIQNYRKEFVKMIHQMAQTYSLFDVFTDFTALFAYSISNSVDKYHFQDREEKYLSLIKKYEPKVQKKFPELCGLLVLALEQALVREGLSDVLGSIFGELELHNQWAGQFFTPDDVCRMMGNLTFTKEHTTETIKKHGYVSLSEPCVGAGAMVLGFADTMRAHELNYQQNLVVHAMDIDIRCVYMAYIQFSLYGIPAIVTHGNTLSLEQWGHWATPAYVLGGWSGRERWRKAGKEMADLFVEDAVIVEEPLAEEMEVKPDIVLPTLFDI